MLESVLKFFSDEINAYLQTQGGAPGTTPVKASGIVGDDGKYTIEDDHVAITIINLEEEAAAREQLPHTTYQDGQTVTLEPPLNLNLYLMFAARFTHYDQAIKYMSHILTFFQTRRVFTREKYAAMNKSLSRLVVELQRVDYEQLNQIWAYIGAKHLPSVVYRVRMVTVQEGAQTGIKPPILKISAKVGRN
jgi:hypothetical protein